MYERTVIGALNIVYFVVSVFYKTGKNDGVMQNVNRDVGRSGRQPEAAESKWGRKICGKLYTVNKKNRFYALNKL